MNDVLTEVRFWSQVTQDSRRTIMCNPDIESRVKGWLSARGLLGFHEVVVSPYVPIDKMFIAPLHR